MTKEKEKQRFYSNPGSQYADIHAIEIDENGHKTLVKTGEQTDIYEKILSHADECDIEQLLVRSKLEGKEILNKKDSIYGDVTVVPKSLMEAQIMLQDRQNEFDKLPIDIRRQFNFSFNEYIAEAGNDIKSWAKKMGFVEKEKQEIVEEIIKEGDEE